MLLLKMHHGEEEAEPSRDMDETPTTTYLSYRAKKTKTLTPMSSCSSQFDRQSRNKPPKMIQYKASQRPVLHKQHCYPARHHSREGGQQNAWIVTMMESPNSVLDVYFEIELSNDDET
jgi:hypothetical protein